MISMHLACAKDGAFGMSNGTLPWGSFPEELELFFGSLYPNRHVLVGGNTWNSLPQSAKDRIVETIVEAGAIVHTVTSAEQLDAILETSVNDITEFQCIGGAYIINLILDNHYDKIDAFHMSLIEGGWPADIYLKPFNEIAPGFRAYNRIIVVRASDNTRARHFSLERIK